VKGTASAVPQQTTGSAALATEARLSSKYAPAPSDTTNRTSGGSIGLQPGESDTQETGASAPDLLSTDKAWKQEQDLFAADVLRYFLLREIPFGQDGSFSFDALVQRYNSDLANGYGNLVSRTLSMIEKYFDGQIPFGKMDEHVGFDVQLCAAAIWNNYIEQDFSSLLINISTIIRAADQYITSTVPWKVAADESRTDELKNILYTAVESIRIVTALIEPVLPYTAARVFSQLGIPVERAPGSDAKWTASKLGPLSPIFPRAPKELIQLMNDMEQNPSHQKSSPAVGLPHITNNADASTPPRSEFVESPISSASASPAQNHIAESTHALTAHHPAPQAPESTPQIAIDDFIKIDLRVAQIVVAERIPKADKLLRLEVDLGYERRQILSGIAQWYTPEELIGRRIVVIANLAPRKMRGLESHGMLLAASHGEDGKPVLATFAEDIPLGSRLK
jgi:methionyl-tRNA synthetase